MWDVLLIVVTLAFFIVAIAYIHACDKLRRANDH